MQARHALEILPLDVWQYISFEMMKPDLTGLNGPSVLVRHILKFQTISPSFAPIVEQAWVAVAMQAPILIAACGIRDLVYSLGIFGDPAFQGLTASLRLADYEGLLVHHNGMQQSPHHIPLPHLGESKPPS